MEHKVKFPREYFSKALLEYSNWRLAMVREFVQNLYDAGAQTAKFQLSTDADGHLILWLEDDGCGMSRDVIENVLLVAGGSKKPDGAVGGFGYAKALLFFAHKSYTINTRDLQVQGSGGEYDLVEVPAFVAGTQIAVRFDRHTDDDLRLMADAIQHYSKFLRTARPLRVLLNGVVLNSEFTDFDYKVDTELGSLLFKDVRASTSRLVVSVSGLPMFEHTVYTSGVDAFVGTLNLLEGQTFELLTTNRDSLKGRYSDQLTRIIQRMIEQRFSFKVGKTLDITMNWSLPISEDRIPGDAYIALERFHELETDHDTLRFMTNVAFPRNFNLRVQNLVGQRADGLAPNTIAVADVLKIMKQKWVQRLAMTWKHLVMEIMRCPYMKEYGVTEVQNNDVVEFYLNEQRISAGFIFAQTLEGLNASEFHERLILCNPMLLTKDFTVPDLCDLAIHECAHLISGGHNDYFIDADMKTRRSLRQYRNEADLDVRITKFIKDWRADRVEPL